MQTNETVGGITYSKPVVTLLHAAPLVNAEVAGRTCYSSFDNSEHEQVRGFDCSQVEDIEHSDLLDSLCHVYFHESVVEHINLTYHISGTSRGVLQEQVRHRIAAYSVKSTRYTMQDVLHAFNACALSTRENAKHDFTQLIEPMDMFVVKDMAATIEIHSLYEKLHYQLRTLGAEEFGNLSMSKSAKDVFANREVFNDPMDLFNALCDCKSKRNVGDFVKGWVVTDSWKVDMVVTFNLRSLKNYFDLRDSGAAFFGIKHLAQAMKDVTPDKYLDLIIKPKKT